MNTKGYLRSLIIGIENA